MTAREFFFALPRRVTPEALEGINTNLQFDVAGSGVYTVLIADGKMKIEEGAVGTPVCTVKVSEENLTKILNKELNPMTAVFTGKLKMTNPTELMRYARMLGLA